MARQAAKPATKRTRKRTAPKTVTLDLVREIALALPDVTEGTSWGAKAFMVGGRMFACQPTHRSAEPDSLVVRIDFDPRDAMLEDAPDTYYLPDHYVSYACVLVRLSRVHPDAMRDLLRSAHTFVSRMPKRKKKPTA